MVKKLLLFLGAGPLHAQRMAGGKIVAQDEFAGTPEGRENFAVFVREAQCPVYLLTDLIEEDFRQLTVPHLSGRNRKALLQRKFEQFYRNTPFRQATRQQRQKAGRRDDDMLFSALTNPTLIKPWVDILLAQQIPLAGIYSVPQISAPLIKDHPSDHLLLITWEGPAGLRQSYFSNHRLQISRLTPLHTGMTFQQAVVEELARTYQYLKSLSLLPHGQTLDVRLIGHSHDLIELQLELPRSADMRYDFVDLADIARQHHCGYRFTDSDASRLFLHLLAARPPHIHYADKSHTHYFALWRLRHTLNLASGSLLLVTLMWGAAQLWQSGADLAEAGSLKIQAQRARDETRQITLAFPGTHAPVADMKDGVSIMHQLDHYDAAPASILHPVSAALDRHPQIELDDLDWRIGAAEPVTPGAPADTPAQLILLKGHLTGFDNDYRATLGYLERFQRDLAARGYRVVALDKPFDVSPGGSIDSQGAMRANRLAFSLKLSRPFSREPRS